MSESAPTIAAGKPPLIEPSASDLIRAHLRNARNLAAEHGYSNLLPLLERAGFGLEEVELSRSCRARVRGESLLP
jgi:hypothetical protein